MFITVMYEKIQVKLIKLFTKMFRGLRFLTTYRECQDLLHFILIVKERILSSAEF